MFKVENIIIQSEIPHSIPSGIDFHALQNVCVPVSILTNTLGTLFHCKLDVISNRLRTSEVRYILLGDLHGYRVSHTINTLIVALLSKNGQTIRLEGEAAVFPLPSMIDTLTIRRSVRYQSWDFMIYPTEEMTRIRRMHGLLQRMNQVFQLPPQQLQSEFLKLLQLVQEAEPFDSL